MIDLYRNAQLVRTTLTEHLSDDPVVLALQISRRLPARLTIRPAAFVAKLMPNSGSLVALVASRMAGDASGLERRFQLAISAPGAGRRTAAADVALAAGRPDWADRFLAHGGRDSAKAAGTIARRQWYDGDMSGAVRTLGGGGRRVEGQRRRLAAELQVFQGWTPSLPRRYEFVPQPSKVLHVLTNSLPHTGSGYAQRTHSILLAQQAAGWETLAVTRVGYPVQVGKVLARDADMVDGVRYERLLPFRLSPGRHGRLQQQAEMLLDVALRFRPCVLHTTTHFVNAIVTRAVADALNIPWVYEVRGQLADTWASTRGNAARGSERYRLFQEREAEAMRSANLVITLGDAMKERIMAAGVDEDAILIAPNAVGGDFLKEPGSPEDARLQLGLDPGGLYIGTVSSLVDYEGLDDLITAFGLLAPQFPTLKLLIVGDGSVRTSLQSQVRELGLEHRAVFTGRVPRERTPLYHQALDVFVVPRKGLEVTRSVTPLKPVEAMASARPVVGSDLPALREIIKDGVTGRLAVAGAPEILAERLAEILTDHRLRIGYGEAGRCAVLDKRTWASNAEQYGIAYNNLRRAT
ncbi:glycosyltransferase [Paenarthrobacter sp. Z7-10]|uniref:glycosyltransferase family 4 protein n=1 Tax=Paenarthrobacter sp. Z7-10 TaxID=2787635 RepID=UPI0022A98204|nr:glycosyltransferase family 4 protein [Paenarthrobacter sp. Z7-10]MCZ2403075.1 glycosyltransferase [Paenarthrobacter sp. Z7-10]